MVLQVDGTGFGADLHRRGGRVAVRQFNILVDDDAVVADRHAGILRQLAGRIVFRRRIVDVVAKFARLRKGECPQMPY